MTVDYIATRNTKKPNVIIEHCEVSKAEGTTALSPTSAMCLCEIKRSNKRQLNVRVVIIVTAVTFRRKCVYITQQRYYCHILASFTNGRCGNRISQFDTCQINRTGPQPSLQPDITAKKKYAFLYVIYEN